MGTVSLYDLLGYPDFKREWDLLWDLKAEHARRLGDAFRSLGDGLREFTFSPAITQVHQQMKDAYQALERCARRHRASDDDWKWAIQQA